MNHISTHVNEQSSEFSRVRGKKLFYGLPLVRFIIVAILTTENIVVGFWSIPNNKISKF
jgi:hypothetical protein